MRLLSTPGNRRGFSFVEMMAVVSILGIALAVTVPQVNKLLQVNRARAAAWDLLRDMRLCQQEALTRKEVWGVVIDGAAGTWFIFRGDKANVIESREFPDGVEVTAIKFGFQKGTSQVVSFNGNGNSEQGAGKVIFVSEASGKQYTINLSINPAKISLRE